MNDTLAAPHQAARPGTPLGLAEMSRRHYGLATLRSIIATWSWRIRFRWELEQISRTNPHLIDDMGLTRRQVEAEIAKRFWQR
ncbi:DUF1127 domain-containing protein [Mesorhizobium sp. M9A.F.Ca.ET.002.03.1.2]|uniref:DUF1127 domain-containing protein n=1 Tax=Mesorhizobium sp. M9A.F.Ca.ET.002.03.1.2 TaxID=2493668 RepID=UPI000F762AB8|nr:DUF1127 domain-containing protein [Mesorhizobium sp. M9A.F.Ca.ET.002.03.1.2]AZN97363.1 DUF1127 domain-containing protein [Mesorhizobium sp. M9A.F.Ca.ET.002.03.1.2]